MAGMVIAGQTRLQAHMRPVTAWLYVMCALVLLMVLVGGLTRLTDSGLSITEWKPIHGIVPPITAAEWDMEFARYQQSPEYRLQNSGMALGEFKRIFWWEWGHRLLGRLVGFAFALPLLWFVVSGRVRGGLAVWLFALLGLGGLQGFVGWIMVASGLEGDRTDVSHFRLAMHLGLAVVIFGLLLWTAQWVSRGIRVRNDSRLLLWCSLLLVLVFGQIILGALVAGLDAGLVHVTWPMMEGAWIPDGLVWGPGMLEDRLTVQFLHRMTAYATVVMVPFVLWRARARRDPGVAGLAATMAVLVLIQAGLGIATLVTVAPLEHIWLAAAHQIGALVVFAKAVSLTFRACYA